MPSADPPPRGTRPSNRRNLIVDAATELFRRRGFEHVTMADIAGAVAVRPSALYRHFAGKQQILAAVILESLAPLRALLDRLGGRETQALLGALADFALANRQVGVLIARETPRLPNPERACVREEVRGIGQRLDAAIAALRPELNAAARDLLTWTLLAVLLSPSFHQVELPSAEYRVRLVGMMRRVLTAPVIRVLDAGPGRPPGAGLLPASRREALLAQSIRMFAERGYASVGVEEVAAAIGIAGPAVYGHFESKADILATALQRACAHLYLQVADVLAGATTPAAALRGLVESYARYALSHPGLIGLLLSEVRNLHEPERRATLQAQRDYVAEWAELAVAVHPALDVPTARLQAHAVLSIINQLARTPHLLRLARIDEAVVDVCVHVLDLSP